MRGLPAVRGRPDVPGAGVTDVRLFSLCISDAPRLGWRYFIKKCPSPKITSDLLCKHSLSVET
jgi:hypothetical protein